VRSATFPGISAPGRCLARADRDGVVEIDHAVTIGQERGIAGIDRASFAWLKSCLNSALSTDMTL